MIFQVEGEKCAVRQQNVVREGDTGKFKWENNVVWGGGQLTNQQAGPQLIELYQPTAAHRQLRILLRHNYLLILQTYFTGLHNCFQTILASSQTS